MIKPVILLALLTVFCETSFAQPTQLYVEGQSSSVIPSDLQLNLVCYTGDAATAEKLIQKDTALTGQILNGQVIRYQMKSSECTESTGEYDGYECLKSRPVTDVFYVDVCSNYKSFMPLTGLYDPQKLCFTGDIHSAVAALTASGKSHVELLGNQAIRYSRQETRCTDSEGEYDGYQCLKDETQTLFQYVESCKAVNQFGDFQPLASN